MALVLQLPTFGGEVEGSRLKIVRASPQYQDGAFKNPEGQAERTGSMAMLEEQFFGDQVRTPPKTNPIIKIDPASLDNSPAGGLRAIWLGHSSVLVEIDGQRILFDPVLSDRASPFQFIGPKRFHEPPISLGDIKHVDAVMISHDHYDHLDMATVKHLAKQGTMFFVPLGVGAHLERWEIPGAQIEEMDWWNKNQIGDLEIIATPNRHYSGRGLTDYNATLWSSWSIVGPQHRIFYSGDTGYSRFFRQIGRKLGPFDLTIIKVGAYGPGRAWTDVHMEPEKAVQVHKEVRGKVMLPVHWGTFNMGFHDWDEPIKRTIAASSEQRVRVVVPQIGESTDVDGYRKN